MTNWISVEERRKYYRGYYWKHRDKKILEMKKFRERRDRNQVNEYQRDYYSKTKNTQQHKDRAAKYRQKNKAKILEAKKQYYLKNRDILKKKIQERTEKKSFGMPRYQLLVRYNNICQGCFIQFDPRKLVIHHIDGQGSNTTNPNNNITNLTVLCRACHVKHHKPRLNR